ncbi:MAG: hypothetical protein WCC26_14335 [Terracidiphilus sp.]
MSSRSGFTEFKEFVALKRLERDGLSRQIDNPLITKTKRDEAAFQRKVIIADLKRIALRLEDAIEAAKRAVAAEVSVKAAGFK